MLANQAEIWLYEDLETVMVKIKLRTKHSPWGLVSFFSFRGIFTKLDSSSSASNSFRWELTLLSKQIVRLWRGSIFYLFNFQWTHTNHKETLWELQENVRTGSFDWRLTLESDVDSFLTFLCWRSSEPPTLWRLPHKARNPILAKMSRRKGETANRLHVGSP